MINADKCQAIYLLHKEGMAIREIGRRLHVSRNTVREVIAREGRHPAATRRDKREIDPELLHRLFKSCGGWVQRVHELLMEEHGIAIGYSTLTRLLREQELGNPKKRRCDQVPDTAGREMQHDTSPYRLTLGCQPVPVVGSLLYFRYSKVRYLKFYRAFNRFKMKCFLHEALMYWRHAAPICIIDNTNLARLRGSGPNAVMVPEMAQFAKQYGFEFVCHTLGHANRKAGNERSFFTVETNFFPGRRFTDMADLNRQALEWATVRLPHRPVGKAGLLPAKAFEYEQAFLNPLPPFIPPPYRSHLRLTDQYGYVAFAGNFYWVPGSARDEVTLLEYSDCLKLYVKRRCLAQYALPGDEVRNQKITPDGKPPPRQPNNRKQPSSEEEQRLRALAPVVDTYLSEVLPPMGAKRHRFVRQLYGLSRKLAKPLFIRTVQRAHQYRINTVETLERIAYLLLSEGQCSLPEVTVDQDLYHRPAYQAGRFSDEVDLSRYDRLLEDDDE